MDGVNDEEPDANKSDSGTTAAVIGCEGLYERCSDTMIIY
jgi:hypothetical protein